MQNIIEIIDNLRKLPSETEWIEFKSNHLSPDKIGESISALSNSACLHQKEEAFLIFGIKNQTHEVEGTNFNHRTTKGKGNEDLEPWLLRHLGRLPGFKIEEIQHPSGKLVVFFIEPAKSGPVKFISQSYIRINSSNYSLNKYPEKEALIWDRRIPFESQIAKENIEDNEVQSLLDFDRYFQLIKKPIPSNIQGIIDIFCREKFLIRKKGAMHISNLGAIVIARQLSDFQKLENKRVRVITYVGYNKLQASKDKYFDAGYAVGFEDLLSYIESQVPSPEEFQSPLRTTKFTYPSISIREFVANALVHQDFSISGTAPLIEIYKDRIEINNPGIPLIETHRFIDTPPKSRNEKLSDILFRMNICEKRGSGVDRAILAIELAKLPAPKIEKLEDSIRITLYSHKDQNNLTKEEKANTCYMHSCIQHVVHQQPMTNSSLCDRMSIESRNRSIASRILTECLDKGLIKLFDPNNKSPKHTKYLPYWA